ncbi:MAG TPA: sugar phosphate nucleotidyltransferase [bacterium]|nr:sugar phosphate nucleotidyltransferase [bacterium]HQL62450.1 sugar phosphate nucleotidyltransferase [bacterium]
MKGVITAGGLGTRLYPMTKVTNKHLLPIYDLPMIYYPIQALINAGIDDIMIITGGNNAGDFIRLLGNGKEFGLKRLSYVYQEGEGGIAAAVSLTRDFVGDDRVAVVLGDNIIENNFANAVHDFQKQERGAKILLKEVAHPEHYGVPTIQDKRIIKITEKPTHPDTNYAVIGIYLYDNRVFDMIERLKPSSRGELEITDVNNAYIEEGTLTYEILDGWWADCGEDRTSLFEASCLVAKTGANKL